MIVDQVVCEKTPLAGVEMLIATTSPRLRGGCLHELPDSLDLAGWDAYQAQALVVSGAYATRCQYNRLHTSFTGLPKLVRRELLLDGEPIVELDVRNCQPLLVGLLASDPDLWRDRQKKGPGGP